MNHLLLVCSMLLLAAMPEHTLANEQLSIESPSINTQVETDGTHTIPLSLDAGYLYTLGIVIDSGRFHLDLVNRFSGRHERRYIHDNVGRATFLLNFTGRELLSLRASALEGGAFQLSIKDRKKVHFNEEAEAPTQLLSSIMSELAKHLQSGGDTNDFWKELADLGTPLVEPIEDNRSVLTFVYRGAKNNVRLRGGPSSDHEELTRLLDSDVWFKSFVVPNNSRLSYQLAPDVPSVDGNWRERRVAILSSLAEDPLNKAPWPATGFDKYARLSTATLPDAPAQPFIGPAATQKGTTTEIEIESAILGNRRMVSIYRANGLADTDEAYPVLFMFDAEHYNGRISVPDILDNMVATGSIPPLAAVFISHIDVKTRSRELPANKKFASFMAFELLPKIEQLLKRKIPASSAILAGSSYGGLGAATVAFKHPSKFANVLSLSGSFWWSQKGNQNHVASLARELPKQDLRFFLSAGEFEQGLKGVNRNILRSNEQLRDALLEKGYNVVYRKYASGHDLLSWQGILSDGLLSLLGTAQQ